MAKTIVAINYIYEYVGQYGMVTVKIRGGLECVMSAQSCNKLGRRLA